jgi:hypothetical protein
MNNTSPRKSRSTKGAAPIYSAGGVPLNHKGPYIPTRAEILDGARAAARVQESIAAERSKDLDKDLDDVFKNWEKK